MISLDVFYPSTIIYYTDRGRQRLQPGSILSKYPDVSCGLHANAAVVVQCQSRNMFQLVIRSEMDCVSTWYNDNNNNNVIIIMDMNMISKLWCFPTKNNTSQGATLLRRVRCIVVSHGSLCLERLSFAPQRPWPWATRQVLGKLAAKTRKVRGWDLLDA